MIIPVSILIMYQILLTSTTQKANAFVIQHTKINNNNLQRVLVRMRGGKGKGGKGRGKKKPQNIYAPTILLPETEFQARANAIKREPELQSYWTSDIKLYKKLSEDRSEEERFVLHDGPPYANGDLHMGHALNKILKDFINRFNLLKGKQVHYIPGWDCHGLPIELKVLQSLPKKERQGLTPITLRQKAHDFALETVTRQSTAFERFGIFGDFVNVYKTLDKQFESKQISVFGEMYKKGYIFRGRKPVHWSPSSMTALAEAELEYPDKHISKSIYVAFPVKHVTQSLEEFKDGLRVAIWTTTPWTIPANLAIAVNPDLVYCVVDSQKTGKIIVAKDLIDTLATKFTTDEQKVSFTILSTLNGSDLIGTTYTHPLYGRESQIVEGGDYITTESGTGLVHTAPGHGQEDYLTGLKYNLDLLSPVDDVGKFTIEAGERFVGKKVLGDGNTEVISALDEAGILLKLEDYEHKYPYDWRTKKPTIVRATDQWFASIEGFRKEALEAVDDVKWIPESGKNRINSFVKSRGDWCISRQRSWGVPIPVFYSTEDGKENVILLDEHTLLHIEQIFAQHGSNVWFEWDEKDLLPDMYKEDAAKWKKGTDTMDVWFDSGTSWAGVASSRDELHYPADLYLEGSDQHRGWFQSSLLTSVAAQSKAPYKTVLTHGFVLDPKGYKMSKSLGNIIDPMTIINGGTNAKTDPPYGADVLRLWAASVDYLNDVSIGDSIIKQTFDSYRKLRNTARYLIGNLFDFDPSEDIVPYDDLPSMDKWMLGRLSSSLREVYNSYEEYGFNGATQELLRFSTADLSNFYLDVAKDRLYISSIDDKIRRRSCQTVLYYVLEGFMIAIAPILPHMAEDLYQNLPFERKDKFTEKSVFELRYPKHLMEYEEFDSTTWTLVRKLRDDINKQMEFARNDKVIGASLEAAAYVYVEDEKERELLKGLESDELLISPSVKTNGVDDLRTALMLSQVQILDSPDMVNSKCDEKYISNGIETTYLIGVSKATGSKCSRCWFYDNNVNKHDARFPDLCQRCNEAIFTWEQKKDESFVVPAKEEEAVSN